MVTTYSSLTQGKFTVDISLEIMKYQKEYILVTPFSFFAALLKNSHGNHLVLLPLLLKVIACHHIDFLENAAYPTEVTA